MAPHPELGRSGPVCPFVAPSLAAGTLRTVAHRWEGPHRLPTMVSLIREAVRLFRSTPWRSSNATLHTLVMVVTELEPSGWWLIDDGHWATKDEAVAGGVMLGQFHPRCRAPAVRNGAFPVNRAPFPVIAIRNMAFHDILFLHDNPAWFEHYRARFGKYYRGGRRVEEKFVALYREAEARRESARLDLATI